MKWFWIISVLFVLAWQAPARADSGVENPVISRIESEGFSVSRVAVTWLGRILITARNKDYLREVVVNRRNGNIMRDSLFPLPGGQFRMAEPETGEQPDRDISTPLAAEAVNSKTVGIGAAGSVSASSSGDETNDMAAARPGPKSNAAEGETPGAAPDDAPGDTSQDTPSDIADTDSNGETGDDAAGDPSDESGGDATGDETDGASADTPGDTTGDPSNDDSGGTSDDADTDQGQG